MQNTDSGPVPEPLSLAAHQAAVERQHGARGPPAHIQLHVQQIVSGAETQTEGSKHTPNEFCTHTKREYKYFEIDWGGRLYE